EDEPYKGRRAGDGRQSGAGRGAGPLAGQARRARGAGGARPRGARARGGGDPRGRRRGARAGRGRRRQARGAPHRRRGAGAGGTDRAGGAQRVDARAGAARAAGGHRLRDARGDAGGEPRRAVPPHQGAGRRDDAAPPRARRSRLVGRGGHALRALGRLRRLESGARSPEPHLGRGARRQRRRLPLDRSRRDGHRDARGGDARRRSRRAGRSRARGRTDRRIDRAWRICERRAHRGAGGSGVVTPARWPRPRPLDERLLAIDRARSDVRHLRVRDLPSLVKPHDLIVVNDAATLPASLRATDRSGAHELRLAGPTASGAFRAVLFGAGDWHTPTEHRPPPAPLDAGDSLTFDSELSATVERVSPISPRLVELRFDREGAALWSALYRLGRPVQYSYLDGPLELWHTQTAYAARPWAVEQPSAGRPLTLGLIGELLHRGAKLATVTHAAGLSST